VCVFHSSSHLASSTQELFARIEEWYCRLEDLARFCPQPAQDDKPASASRQLDSPGMDSPHSASDTPGTSSAHYLALLSPEQERTSAWLGVRVRQWKEGGRHLVKLENIGDKRIRLAQVSILQDLSRGIVKDNRAYFPKI